MNSKSLLAVFKDPEEFPGFCEEVVTNTKKAQTLSKIVGEFPQNKRGELWRSVVQAVRENAPKNTNVFLLACILIDAWLDANDKEQIPPASLVDLVAEVHDALFELHADQPIQDEVSKVCERWYLESRPGRDRVLPQLVPTVVLQSLQADGSPVRAFNLRETLLMFDLDDESSLPLKKLLIQCFVSPAHLNSNQGRKFLSYVMTLSDELMFAAHSSIKNQLLALKNLKSERRVDAISNFARIYYGVWQNLKREKQGEDDELREKKSQLLEAFEMEIVQKDFMNSCIFCEDEQLGKICLKLLNAAFHDNKKDRSVDSMLARRYEPIIWRGLGAVNATVRRNAAVVLFNAFPLHDPEAKLEEISRSLQRQFDAITTLLSDPCPDVRITAIEGTCRVLALYWETIPTQKSSKYLQTIVNDLAHDRTSPPVRAAVLRSMGYMLDFPLPQAALKIALPHLRRHLNDRSVIVRTEMAKLLVKVDSTTGFKFTEVCSPGSILTRLVEDVDVSAVIVPLCQLLAPSFYPVDAPSVEQLKRAKSLATTNYKASQVFFKNLHRFVDVNKVAKLALLFGSFIRARKREVETTECETEEEKADEVAKACEEIHVALETICVLWESIAKPIANSPHFASAKESLLQTFAHDGFIVPLYEWKTFCEDHEGSLLRLSALVPCELQDAGESTEGQSKVSALERRIIRSIFLASESCSLVLEKKVDLVVEWNRWDRVLKEVVRSLTVHVNGESEVKRKVNAQIAIRVLNQLLVSLVQRQVTFIGSSSKKTKKSKRALSKQDLKEEKNQEEVEGQTIEGHANSAEEGLDEEEQTATLLDPLLSNEGLMVLFELARPKVVAGESDEILTSLALLEMKMNVHSSSVQALSSSVEASNAPTTLIRALEWCTNRISFQDLEFLNKTEVVQSKVTKHSKKKKTNGESSANRSSFFEDINDDDADEEVPKEALATNFFGAVVHLASDSLALRLGIHEAVIGLIDAALGAGSFTQLLQFGLHRLLFQLRVQLPNDDRVDDLIRGAYHACEDATTSALIDDLVATFLQKFQERTFVNIVMPLLRDGVKLFLGKPVSLMRAFICALDALRAAPEDESLAQAVQYFARGAHSSRSSEVFSQLVRFSERNGGMVGDMLFNLAHELKEEAA